MANLIKLTSVGSVLDTDTLTTYPLSIDGNPDTNCPVPLSECTAEWYENLSVYDDAFVFAMQYFKW